MCACPSLPWLVGFHYTDRLRVKVLTEKCFTPSQLMPHHRATTPYSHPSVIIEAFCIKVMVSTLTHSFKSSPERYQLICFEVTICTSTHTYTCTHTHSHCVDATQYRGLSSRTCPFTSCSHQTWHEAAGFFVPQNRTLHE